MNSEQAKTNSEGEYEKYGLNMKPVKAKQNVEGDNEEYGLNIKPVKAKQNVEGDYEEYGVNMKPGQAKTNAEGEYKEYGFVLFEDKYEEINLSRDKTKLKKQSNVDNSSVEEYEQIHGFNIGPGETSNTALSNQQNKIKSLDYLTVEGNTVLDSSEEGNVHYDTSPSSSSWFFKWKNCVVFNLVMMGIFISAITAMLIYKKMLSLGTSEDEAGDPGSSTLEYMTQNITLTTANTLNNTLDYGTSQYSGLYTTSFKLRMYFAVSCKALLLVTDTLICAAVPKGVYIYDSKSLTKKLLKPIENERVSALAYSEHTGQVILASLLDKGLSYMWEDPQDDFNDDDHPTYIFDYDFRSIESGRSYIDVCYFDSKLVTLCHNEQHQNKLIVIFGWSVRRKGYWDRTGAIDLKGTHMALRLLSNSNFMYVFKEKQGGIDVYDKNLTKVHFISVKHEEMLLLGVDGAGVMLWADGRRSDPKLSISTGDDGWQAVDLKVSTYGGINQVVLDKEMSRMWVASDTDKLCVYD